MLVLLLSETNDDVHAHEWKKIETSIFISFAN